MSFSWEEEQIQLRLASFKHKINEEMFLLENGLIALKKGKTHITEDHLERVIYNLKKICS